MTKNVNTIQKYFHAAALMCCTVFVLFCSVQNSFSQVAKPSYSPLTCTFMKFDITVQEGQVVTNVLSVKNQNGRTREFYIETGCPSDWKILGSSKRVFTLDPDDSLFIPIRLLPNIQTMKGGTKYNVSVFVVGTDGQTHAVCSFNVGKPKRVEWDMKVLPRNRIYFLNDQYDASLGINVSNRGEEAQEVNLSWKVLGQGLSLTTDSSKQKSFLDLLVGVDRDTTITFFADLSKPQRNFKRIDSENYRPTFINDARKYTIYFRGAEPKSQRGNSSRSVNADLVKLNSAVDFIKLSNNYTVNSYGSSVIPLTWYSNVYNILGYQPIWMNSFMLHTPIKKETFLSASLQHGFNFYSPSQQTLRNFAGTLSYYTPKWDMTIGQGVGLRGEMMNFAGAGGTGISGSYRIIPSVSVSAFYGRIPGLIASQGQSYGAGVSYKTLKDRLMLSGGYTRQEQFNISNQNNIFGGFRFRFLKNHDISARLGQTIASFSNPPGTVPTTATNWFVSYGGGFFNNRLRQSFSFGRNTAISPFNNFLNNSLFASSSTSFQAKSGYGITLSGSYMQNEFISPISTNTLVTIPINLQFSIPRGNRFFSLPSLFYTYTNDGFGKLDYGGFNIGFSHYNYEKNIRASANFMGGYNVYSDTVNYKPLFTANAFAMVAWRTLSANVRYMYGPMGIAAISNFNTFGTRYPQYIFNSVNYQYVFKETRFVGEMSLNHSWNNQTYANNLFLAPNIYFYTKNGWRFNLLFSYGLNARNNERAVEFYQYQGNNVVPEPEQRMSYNNNFNISVGLRKQFGIPIPKKFRKVQYVNANFLAFLDFNGNKVMDNDEVPLENVVIKVNGHEVLTDKDGKGKFVNIPCGTYEHKIIPLVDLDGWFTYSMDSIDIIGEQYYVPFTRGVKVAGSIVLDREKFTKDVLATLDLSGIKIFTTDTSGYTMATITDMQGNFNFYVPYGSYILSMDEDVLGDRFYIAQNHIPMDLYDGMDGFYQSFFIIEKRRNVKKKKFNEKGELIMVDEVEGGLDRNQNNSTIINEGDSTVIHNNNTEYNIFNEERKGGGSGNVNADELYKELDERIDRLDAIIRMLLEGKAITKADNKILADALRSLKAEDDAKRQNGNAPKPIMETINPDKHFHVVVGGFVYRENAERFLQQLKAKGMSEAVIIGVFNGYYLVRIKDYATLEEGIAGQEQYKNVAEGVWVHKWP